MNDKSTVKKIKQHKISPNMTPKNKNYHSCFY